jgi:hypothetical protein
LWDKTNNLHNNGLIKRRQSILMGYGAPVFPRERTSIQQIPPQKDIFLYSTITLENEGDQQYKHLALSNSILAF